MLAAVLGSARCSSSRRQPPLSATVTLHLDCSLTTTQCPVAPSSPPTMPRMTALRPRSQSRPTLPVPSPRSVVSSSVSTLVSRAPCLFATVFVGEGGGPPACCLLACFGTSQMEQISRRAKLAAPRPPTAGRDAVASHVGGGCRGVMVPAASGVAAGGGRACVACVVRRCILPGRADPSAFACNRSCLACLAACRRHAAWRTQFACIPISPRFASTLLCPDPICPILPITHTHTPFRPAQWPRERRHTRMHARIPAGSMWHPPSSPVQSHPTVAHHSRSAVADPLS